MTGRSLHGKGIRWIALACLVVPMFASYYFDDMFSTLSHLFDTPQLLQLGWNAADYGLYTSGYSVLCVFGGLVICGILLDRWGVRITGSIFVGMMVLGAGLVTWAISSGLSPKQSLDWAYLGCMLFGLGSEIAGVSVTRSIAKWFKGGPMALAMGLQLAIARLGTAFALVMAPRLVATKGEGEVYLLSETARPAYLGMSLMAAGVLLWLVFVYLDYLFDRRRGQTTEGPTSEGSSFSFRDVVKLLANKEFLTLAFLCVFFYSSVVAFKKFASAILIPRFGIPVETAGWMVSMLPFTTVIFAPLFGILVDKSGKGTLWMVIGAVLALAAHLMMAFLPVGKPLYGYISMGFLGFAYSLVPAAMWPSVPKIVPESVLGTAFSLIYWVQNIGLMLFKMFAGEIFSASSGDSLAGSFHTELMFVAVCAVSLALAIFFRQFSSRNPSLGLDSPSA